MARAKSARYAEPMAASARKEATYDDILALPPGIHGQILFGVLHAHPRLIDVYAKEAKVRAIPFDAIELDLALLWAR